MRKVLVVCASVDPQHTAERFDLMLIPEQMYGVQSFPECGVKMAIAFFRIRFSSSN